MRSWRSSTNSFRALLFDFDGVIADTEPVHLQMFRKLLAAEKIDLASSDYNQKYLGLDDRSCLRAVYRDQGRELSPEKLDELVASKNRELMKFVRGKSLLLPDVAKTIHSLQGRYYLAIVSGALKSEIEAILDAEGLRPFFHVVIGAEEVSRGKPDPEGFLLAVKLLNRDHIPESEILLPEECLVLEDSPWGIEAANKAGIPCYAVTTSYPAEKLTGAAKILSGIGELPALLEAISPTSERFS